VLACACVRFCAGRCRRRPGGQRGAEAVRGDCLGVDTQ
jgi:hypothetical protein